MKIDNSPPFPDMQHFHIVVDNMFHLELINKVTPEWSLMRVLTYYATHYLSHRFLIVETEQENESSACLLLQSEDKEDERAYKLVAEKTPLGNIEITFL